MNHAHFMGMPRCTQPTRSGRVKWRFRSELAALMVSSSFARYKPEGANFVYECPYCGGWHMTKQDQAKR